MAIRRTLDVPSLWTTPQRVVQENVDGLRSQKTEPHQRCKLHSPIFGLVTNNNHI